MKKEQLKCWLSESENIVFLGGAGVSTASGIPDFRSSDGLYSQKYKFSPERILSYSFFRNNPDVFFEFYKEKILLTGILPNPAHFALAKLEQKGRLKAVITQNIDNLHQMAGSKNVLELHGSSKRNFCIKCRKKHPKSFIITANGVPRCGDCGGVVRPDVVMYEEQLDADVMKKAIAAITAADVFVVGGTSLAVYPAAGLTEYYNGNKLVVINKTEVMKELHADLVINEDIAEVLTYAVL